VVFHIGAGTPAKQWPVEHWRELLGRAIIEFDAQVMLVGSEADRIIARRILGPAAWPNLVDGTGRLSLMELAGVLQQADVLIGADSGPAHLAAAVGTPVVALFSGTNSSRQWQPWGTQVTVVRHPVPCSPCHREQCPMAEHPCMRGVKPEEVVEAMREVQGSGSWKQGAGARG
jgi:ADP-heptose:LPS heptosyltransferase